MELEQALAIAKKVYGYEGDFLEVKAYDTGDCFIVFGKTSPEPVIGGYGILINKETGMSERFKLPSAKNFKILESATEIKINGGN
ncbi:MAG: hypothetical protein IJM14_05525 [Lachnospiraceae bacterium]|nr:hypothetical protein [Lachnospiraceae bacterium]